MLLSDNHFFIVRDIDYDDSFKSLRKKNLKKARLKIVDGNLYINNDKTKIDLVLPLCHGKYLEDSSIFGYFKTLNQNVMLTKPLYASLFQNKFLTKLFLKDVCNTIGDYYLEERDFYSNIDKTIEDITNSIKSHKYIIKANTLGSSVGIKIASSETLKEDIIECLRYDSNLIIERCLENYEEYTIAVYKNITYIKSSIEQIKDKAFYKYESKYQKHEIEFVKDKRMIELINSVTDIIIEKLKFNGLCRLDYLYDLDEGKLYLCEINATPGALSYYLFEDSGIYFDDLLNLMISEAKIEYQIESSKIKENNRLDLLKINNKK